MANIQSPGGGYEDDADAVARRLVEGTEEEPEAKAATPVAAKTDGKNEPGPYGMTLEAWTALGPEGQWAKLLEQFKVTPDNARTMMRQILTKGHVTKAYPLWGGALKISLRNPHGEHRLRVARELDRLNNPTNQMENEARNRLNLAGCLLSYDDGENPIVKFNFPDKDEKDPKVLDELFDARMTFAGTIPHEVQPHVYVVLNHFMGLVTAVLANGAVGSF